jgi:hypothetical protein
MESRKFTLQVSPFSPDVEVVFDMAVKRHAPFSAKSVTVMVSPNITHYEVNPVPNFRQVSVYKSTPETKTLTFDLDKNQIHKVEFEGHTITLKLVNIDTEQLPTVAASFRYHFVATRA